MSIVLGILVSVMLGCLTPSPMPMPTLPSPAVDSADEALATVLAMRPDLGGAIPTWQRSEPDGPIVGRPPERAGTTVTAMSVAGAIVLTFRTTFGDCPSGCTQAIVEVFSVWPDGSVVVGCPDPSAPKPTDAAPSAPIDDRSALPPCGVEPEGSPSDA